MPTFAIPTSGRDPKNVALYDLWERTRTEAVKTFPHEPPAFYYDNWPAVPAHSKHFAMMRMWLDEPDEFDAIAALN